LVPLIASEFVLVVNRRSSDAKWNSEGQEAVIQASTFQKIRICICKADGRVGKSTT
jgi:hypothetical protein